MESTVPAAASGSAGAGARGHFREPALVALIIAGTMLLLALPYVLAHRLAGPDVFFTGILMNPEDAQTYFAKMLQGYDGHWLYTIPFTPEPHAATPVGIFYIWLGQLARALDLSIMAVWHGARVLAQALLFLTTYWFISRFTLDSRTRLVAYLLALFGSGLGWLLFLLGQPYWLDAFPVDFKQPGAHLFFTALTFPHIALATALIMFSVWALWTLSERPSLPLALLVGVTQIGLTVAYPFLIYLTALIAALVLAWQAWQRRRLPWRTTGLFGLVFAVPLPLLLAYAWVLQVNPVFVDWDRQSTTPSLPWPHYLVAFGPLLLLAMLNWRRQPGARRAHVPLWCWVTAVALLVYAPLNPQRRFVQGVHAPLSILAAHGFVTVVLPAIAGTRAWQRVATHRRYSTAGLSRLAILLFLLLMSLSNVYVLASVSLSAVVQQPDPLFRPRAEQAAAAWLRQAAAPTEVVLAAYQTGNYVAAHGGQRVVMGHWSETMAFAEKEAEVNAFYATDVDNRWRRELLRRYNVSLVWYGPREKALGGFDPTGAPFLVPVYRDQGIEIYRVSEP